MSYDPRNVAFVDTETTGLDPELDHVWEVAVIVDEVEHVWQQQLPELNYPNYGPDWSQVSDWVLENTRIRDDYDHTLAYDPATSIDMFASLVRGRHLVGACPWFDSERLHRVSLAHYGQESGERGLPWHYHLIDVENLAVGYLRGRHAGWASLQGQTVEEWIDEDVDPLYNSLPWKSVDLSLAIGVDPADFEPKHTALADARWAKAMYEAIMGAPT